MENTLTVDPTSPRQQSGALPENAVGVSTKSSYKKGRYASKGDSRSNNADDSLLNSDEAVGEGMVGDTEWGSEAVKVAVFGDMGTAEIDGTLDAGHTEELPSIQTVGILRKELGVGAGRAGGRGEGAEGVGRAVEPQLGLVLHIGDLSYARGYDAQWDEVRWFSTIQEVKPPLKDPWIKLVKATVSSVLDWCMINVVAVVVVVVDKGLPGYD